MEKAGQTQLSNTGWQPTEKENWIQNSESNLFLPPTIDKISGYWTVVSEFAYA